MNNLKKFFSTLSRKNKAFEDSSEPLLSALLKNNNIDKNESTYLAFSPKNRSHLSEQPLFP